MLPFSAVGAWTPSPIHPLFDIRLHPMSRASKLSFDLGFMSGCENVPHHRDSSWAARPPWPGMNKYWIQAKPRENVVVGDWSAPAIVIPWVPMIWLLTIVGIVERMMAVVVAVVASVVQIAVVNG